MKIGLAHNLYYPYARGGAEKVVEKMAAEFLAQNHEVFLITTQPRKKTEIKTITENKTTNKKLKIYRLSSSYYNLNEKNKLARLIWHLGDFYHPARKNRLKKIIAIEKPDLFITHNLSGLGFSLIKILNKENIRHEHFLHDIQLLHPSGLMLSGQEKKISTPVAKLYQSLSRQIFKKTAKVISPSNWLLEEHLKKDFFKKSEKEIRPLRELKMLLERSPEEKDKKKGKFIFVGQIEKHKGVLFLIKSFRENNAKNISLKIIGAGKDQSEAEKAAAGDNRISFLGRLETVALKEEMKKAGTIIVPSLCYENSPTVIYEAREIGLSIIAANLGGIAEIVGPKDLLFKAGNKESLLEKITAFS